MVFNQRLSKAKLNFMVDRDQKEDQELQILLEGMQQLIQDWTNDWQSDLPIEIMECASMNLDDYTTYYDENDSPYFPYAEWVFHVQITLSHFKKLALDLSSRLVHSRLLAYDVRLCAYSELDCFEAYFDLDAMRQISVDEIKTDTW